MEKTVALIQLPLLTRSSLEPEEQDYYDTYWLRMGDTFGHVFNQAEVYTIPEFPLWVTQLANAAKDAGWRPVFIDLAKYTGPRAKVPLDEIREILGREPASCYAFSPFTNSYSLALELARMIKRQIDPKARVIIGGAHATALPDKCVSDGFDMVVRGKGEDALRGILRFLEGEGSLDKIAGVTYRDRGMIRHAVDSPRDDAAGYFNRLPEYGLIPVDYKVHFGRVYGSLGCPYGCSFCADTLWIKMKPLHKSVDVIVREIEMIRERYGVNLFLFGDEVFTIKPSFVIALCDALRPLGIQWFCQTRANLVSPELMKKMAASGCRLIQIGAESADEAVLELLEKKVDFDRVRRACADARDAGLNVLSYWMVGGPGETMASAERTRECIERLFDDDLTQIADYYICTPYPGTDLYNAPERYGVQIFYEKGFDDWREDQPSVMRTKELDEHQIFDLWKKGLSQITSRMRKPSIPAISGLNALPRSERSLEAE